MTNLPPDESPAHPPVAPPPATSYARLPESRSDWPKILGIVAIIFGSLGILGGCWGIVTPFFQEAIEKMVSQSGGPDVFGPMRGWQGWTVAASLLSMALAVLLLVLGIGLVKRRPWSIRCGFIWAVLKIFLVFANSIVGYFIQQDMFKEMRNMSGGGFPLGPKFFDVMGAVGIAFGTVWGWALPVFMIVWFSRRKIRAEVGEWSVASGAA